MKQYPHQHFIRENQIDINQLPQDLQKRIRGFEYLEKEMENTTEQDKEVLQEKLDQLDQELEEDLEEHFEDLLENNESIEDQQEQDQPMSYSESPNTPLSESKLNNEETQTMKPPETTHSPEKRDMMEEKISALPSDEQLLIELKKNNRHHITSKELRKRGFKGSLKKRKVRVGNHLLQRGRYDQHYNIHHLKD